MYNIIHILFTIVCYLCFLACYLITFKVKTFLSNRIVTNFYEFNTNAIVCVNYAIDFVYVGVFDLD